MANEETDRRTCKHKGGQRIFKAVEIGVLKFQMNWNLSIVEIEARSIVTLLGPHFIFAEMNGCTALFVAQTDVNAESDAGKHQFAHDAGRIAHAFINRGQILTEVKTRQIDAGRGAIAKLRMRSQRAEGADRKYNRNKNSFHVTMINFRQS